MEPSLPFGEAIPSLVSNKQNPHLADADRPMENAVLVIDTRCRKASIAFVSPSGATSVPTRVGRGKRWGKPHSGVTA
jgi:hypothetical protein